MKWIGAAVFAILAAAPAVAGYAAISDALLHRCHPLNGGDCAEVIGFGLVCCAVSVGLLGLGWWIAR